MYNRWTILFVLTFARTVMAFQYQSIAALSPVMLDSLAITLVDIGVLIGLYFGPGVIIALLGGTVAVWLGDKRTAMISIALMGLGGCLIAIGSSLETLLAGRLISGVGGVIVNVLMTKLVIDWFSGRSLGTAMAVFLNSWPLGIAIAVLLLPLTAKFAGLTMAWISIVAFAITALLLFAVIYRQRDGATQPTNTFKLASLPWVPLAMASAVWGLYNAGVAMIFSFGPIIMANQGNSASAASVAVSLFMIAIAIGAPTGGWLADRMGNSRGIILFALLAGIALFPALLFVPPAYVWLAYGVTGLIVGLSPGLIVSLPSGYLTPEARSFGMGVFYAGYYLFMTLAPPFAAKLAELLGNVELTYLLAAGFMAAAILPLLVLRAVEAKMQRS